MFLVEPFRALRPAPGRAAEVLAPPYDVLSSAEARQRADGKPWSFLHVSKPEIDLATGVDPYSDEVYDKAAENLQRMIAEGVLIRDEEPAYYVYRLTWRDRTQTGLAAVASIADYLTNRIRKHELTTPAKEDDRVRQIEAINAQTGPVMMAYSAAPSIDAPLAEAATRPAEVDVTTDDGVRHQLWVIDDAGAVVALSAWGLGQLGGLEDYWCVDRQVESELEGFKGVVVALGHGERLVPGHSVLLNREEDFVCSVDLETNDLTRLAQPLGDADLHVRTRAALRPELDAWLAETHPDAETLLAVQDVADDHRVLVDYGSLDQPAVLPDERLAQAWALVLLGDPEGARARLKGLARPDRLVPLARLHFVLGEFSVAEEVILLRLREEDPGDPEALLLLANIQAMTGRTEEGDQTFAQAEAARAARR